MMGQKRVRDHVRGAAVTGILSQVFIVFSDYRINNIAYIYTLKALLIRLL